MNFTDAAQFACAYPAASITGAVVGSVVLWKGAKAAFKSLKARAEREEALDRRLANLPSVPRWVPPEERPRL